MALRIDSVHNIDPSPRAPYFVTSKSRAGNSGGLMRARMAASGSASAPWAIKPAAVAVRKVLRFMHRLRVLKRGLTTLSLLQLVHTSKGPIVDRAVCPLF